MVLLGPQSFMVRTFFPLLAGHQSVSLTGAQAKTNVVFTATATPSKGGGAQAQTASVTVNVT